MSNSSLRTIEGNHAGSRWQSTSGRPLGVLLNQAHAADWSAWHELERRFGRLLFFTARGIGLSHSDAADVTQLTWLRFWEHGHQIRDPERLGAWLTATARREGLRIALRGKRYVLSADPTVERGEDHRTAVHDRYPADGEYEPDVERALARLPLIYQNLLRLLMSDSCPSYIEVAKKMNLPVGSIGPMRMRALEMLRRAPELRAGRFARHREAC